MKFLLVALLFPLTLFANMKGIPRVDLNLDDMKPVITGSLKDVLEIKFDKETLYWERPDDILRPYVHLTIEIPKKSPAKYLTYKDQEYHFELVGKMKKAYLKFSLFDNDSILIDDTTIHFYYTGKKKVHHIDYDCIKYQVKIEGANDLPLTVSCFNDVFGESLELKNILKIVIKIPHWDVNDINILARESDTKRIIIENKNREKKELKISYKMRERKKRLNLALGLGPYQFSFLQEDFEKEVVISPIMLYGNVYLVDEHSFRMFDFFAYNESMFFNNMGLYYAYTMAAAFDGLIKITPLIGLQGINVRNDFKKETFSDLIGPQGFEVTWHHSFGIENYLVGVGMFLSPGQGTDYKNVWIRWGKGFFWELNFLSYRKEKKEIYTKSWGLSVGFPIGSFF